MVLLALCLSCGHQSTNDTRTSTHQPDIADRPGPTVRVGGADVAALIRDHVAEGGVSGLGGFTPDERQAVERLYEANGYVPQWVDATGRSTADAIDALTVIDRVTADVLDPHDRARPDRQGNTPSSGT